MNVKSNWSRGFPPNLELGTWVHSDQWNCYSDLSPILARPESFVEKSDIFIFIHVADQESPRYE